MKLFIDMYEENRQGIYRTYLAGPNILGSIGSTLQTNSLSDYLDPDYFLAVQNSSIGDLVPCLLGRSVGNPYNQSLHNITE